MNTASLQEALERLRRVRIVVLGDLMLDEYIWGDVVRISPDAPVPVVEVRRRTQAIGGAGNVAHNIVAAGGSASILAVVGDDAGGGLVTRLLKDAGVGVEGIVVDPGRATTVKTRVVARGQQVVRLDEETRVALSSAARGRLLASLPAALEEADAVIVSDYAKGVVDERLVGEIAERCARRRGEAPPIFVDPKARDFTRYTGCFAITPNQKEALAAAGQGAVGEEELAGVAARIRASSGASWVLITRGEKGMALSAPDGAMRLFPARAREVYDVTGAGDIVIAWFCLGIASGLDPEGSAELANLAAGLGVAKVGTATVGPSEILASEIAARGERGKAVSLGEAAARCGHERSVGRAIVLTNGCFDLLHAGHVHLLEKARELGDFLIVAVNSDASVTRLKGPGRPVLAEADRVRILAALDAVDLVVVFDEDTPIEVVRQIRPDVLVKGSDYQPESIVGYDIVRSYGGRVATVPLASGRSTSGLIAAINKLEPPR